MTAERSPGLTFSPNQVFPDFEWQAGSRPEELCLNRAGFFEDEAGAWHLVRRAHTDLPLSEVVPADLYSGTRPNYHNATQGAGLYFTNTVEAATNVIYAARAASQPRNLFIATVTPDPERLLDATNPLEGRKLREHAAAQLLRAMAVVPGLPWPTPRMYDFMYDDNSLVVSKPSAMQRYRAGMRAHIGREIVRPRYAVVRDLSSLAISGRRSG